MTTANLAVIASFATLPINTEELLERAKRDWYRDEDASKPNQVWATVPLQQQSCVAAVLRVPDAKGSEGSNGRWVWRCESKAEVILLCKFLSFFDGVNFWGISPRT